MKKTLAKILALALCAVLLVTGTVFVTLAYLTSSTDVVKNTFCTGNVTITLDEAKVSTHEDNLVYADGKFIDANGAVVDHPQNADRVQEQKYKIYPGCTYNKAPAVHVGDGSDECFVYIAIRDTLFNDTEYETAVSGMTVSDQLGANGWKEMPSMALSTEDGTAQKILEFADGGGYKIYYFYREATSSDIYIPTFTSITISNEVTTLELDDAVIEMIAFAVQTEGFDIVEKDGVEYDDFDNRAEVAFTSTFGKAERTG